MADLKMVMVPKLDAQGKQVLDEAKKPVFEAVLERVSISTWLANGHTDLEGPIYVQLCFCQPGDGVFPDRELPKSVSFTPSAELRAKLVAEVKAAIAKAIA